MTFGRTPRSLPFVHYPPHLTLQLPAARSSSPVYPVLVATTRSQVVQLRLRSVGYARCVAFVVGLVVGWLRRWLHLPRSLVAVAFAFVVTLVTFGWLVVYVYVWLRLFWLLRYVRLRLVAFVTFCGCVRVTFCSVG